MASILKRRVRRGFMLADALAGLALIVALATALAVGINRQTRAERKLADRREAMRIAEEAITALRTTGQISKHDAAQIEIRPAEVGWRPAGFAWAEVQVKAGDDHARLIGLVPSKAMPAEGGKQ